MCYPFFFQGQRLVREIIITVCYIFFKLGQRLVRETNVNVSPFIQLAGPKLHHPSVPDILLLQHLKILGAGG